MKPWSELGWCWVPALALPPVVLLVQAWRGTLGPNPLEALVRTQGDWALWTLLVVLAITPAKHAGCRLCRLCSLPFGRRAYDWNWLIYARRPIGLASFAYALLHGLVYFMLDAGLDTAAMLDDLREKPFMQAGVAGFVLLVPLALTSTQRWKRRLRRNWKRLHRLVYLIGVLGVLHYQWLLKPGASEALPYIVLLGMLLAYRVVVALSGGPAHWLAEGEQVPRRAGRDAFKGN